MKKIFISLALCSSALIFAQAPSLQWVKTINGDYSDYDVPSKTCKDANGNSYVTGWNGGYDIFLVKFDNNGNQLYKVIYDGPLNSYDRSYDVIADNNGNAYVAGYASASTFGQNQYPFVVKYDANGNKLWEYLSSVASCTF